jgi:hypothetical protein
VIRRIADRGAVAAGWVGVGMAVTIGLSFLLVIPIEPVVWLLAPVAGVMIGYYANQRSDRRAGPWSRILRNAVYAGVVTGITFALFLLAVKALFFFADSGYRDAAQGGPIECRTGAECVYRRYLEADRNGELGALGITDADEFTTYYWNVHLQSALLLIGITTVGGLVGGLVYGATRPKGAAAPRVEAGAG